MRKILSSAKLYIFLIAFIAISALVCYMVFWRRESKIPERARFVQEWTNNYKEKIYEVQRR